MQDQALKRQFRLADKLYRSRRYDEALSLLQELNVLYPKNAPLMYAQAQCLQRMGRRDDAIRLCVSLEEQSNDPRASTLKQRLLAEGDGVKPLPTTLTQLLSGYAGNVSLLFLILGNVLPAVGVMLWGWRTETVLVVYWLETLVIGFFNLLKMTLASDDLRCSLSTRLIYMVIFCVHFAIFFTMHGLLLMWLLNLGSPEHVFASLDTIRPLTLPLQLPMAIVRDIWPHHAQWAGRALAALCICHAGEFIRDFLIGGAFHRTSIRELAGEPYGRIIVLHATLCVGAIGVIAAGSPGPLLLVLIVVKTWLDIGLVRYTQYRRAMTRANA